MESKLAVMGEALNISDPIISDLLGEPDDCGVWVVYYEDGNLYNKELYVFDRLEERVPGKRRWVVFVDTWGETKKFVKNAGVF